MSETMSFRVTGMTCGGCENAVKRALGRLDGVTDVTASHAEERVGVTFDPAKVTPEAIRQKIAAAGYTVAG
jgi:copper chaperone CopZ